MAASYVKFDDEKLSNFHLFLEYLQVSDPTITDAFRWSMAIRDKIFKMNTAYEDVFRQIPIWYSDHEEMKKKGHGSTKEGVILALRYETFLNSIYSLCEGLACLIMEIYPKANFSPHFNKQKKAFLTQKRHIDPDYAVILDTLNWYNEVNAIRGEAPHFLSGFITISENGEPGYFNKPKGGRKGTPQEISKDSIEKHIQEIYQNLDNFLLRFGDHFIQKIDPNRRVPKICMLDGGGYVGARERSLNDIINQKPGICHTPLYQCPIRHSCEAFRNTPGIKDIE
jgi:hypothetical protein